ncbi:MAG TPA: carboxypeptidase-like regulatory domain-containing protein, partial [Chitinophagaceae bacterium]|nr:carboxypeptidase-like regulatory domain-containing protein [Chitinophagaceae bacterium]
MYPKLKRITFLLLILLSCTAIFAQQRTLSGTITNKETSEPLPGATVAVKGTDRVTSTNAKGEFSIAVYDESVLKITMVGFLYQEIPVGSQTSLAIALQLDKKQMEEVVVVGYGSQRKTHLTGAVGVIEMKKVEDLPVGNLTEALKGQIVGVSVSGGFSRPGEPATLTIRNPVFMSKDGGSKEPLFVIDDIIRSKSDFDLLDATEVESISVLKDAAAAIYGILGSNGVVVVKTKRGKSGLTA